MGSGAPSGSPGPWIQEVLPQPSDWSGAFLQEDGVWPSVWVFRRRKYGIPCWDILTPRDWVMHGTTLSQSQSIIRSGFLIGTGEHAKNGRRVCGIFVVSGGPPRRRFALARDRATASRCSEWQGWPSSWSVPVVLAMPYGGDGITLLHPLGSEGCFKAAVELPSAEVVMLRDVDVMLIVDPAAANRYKELESLQEQGLADDVMICGGMQRYGPTDGDDTLDVLYWSRENVNMAPSCGHYIRLADLREGADTGWSRSKKAKVWKCPACGKFRGVDEPRW